MLIFFLVLLVLWLVYLLVSFDAKRDVTSLKVDGSLTGIKVLRLNSWLNRRLGLLNHISVPNGEGYLFPRTKSVHTKGMLSPIDIAFLDSKFNILELRSDVPPGVILKGSRVPSGCSAVLELAQGALVAEPKLDRGRSVEFI